MWGKEFDSCLKKYGLDPQNQDHRDWLDSVIFLNSADYLRPSAEYKFEWDKENNKLKELWVRIFGYTTFGDLPKEEIKRYQQLLPYYIDRSEEEKRVCNNQNSEDT